MKYLLIFSISFLIFIGHVIYTKHAIYGDGNGYYTYTQALYFDKNLNFAPIYKHLSNFTGRKYIFSRIFWPTDPNTQGILNNPFPIGTAIVWIPSMVAIHALQFILNLNIGRFDLIYELGPGITGLICMIAGLYFLEKHLAKICRPPIPVLLILTIYLGSNVLYYTAFEPALSHQPAFFLVSFMLWFASSRKPGKFKIILLGVLWGLLASIRLVDSLLIVPIIMVAGIKTKDIPLLLITFIVGFSPQLINQNIQYGSFFVSPYLNGASGTWDFKFSKILEHLFGIKRGLFFWTPLMFLGFVGLVKSKKYFIIFSLVILWIISSTWSAYLSAGFGQRFSFSAIPFFAVGLAYLYKNSKPGEIIIYGVPFVLWNFILLILFYMLELGS